MRSMSIGTVAAFFSGFLPFVSLAHAEDKVEFKVVKYAGLAETVKHLRGKVVVVDFWATTCVPCKERFPHMVDMYRKYAKEGLAVVSVSIDYAGIDPDDATKENLEKVNASVLKFLKSQKATFTNLILNEPPAVLDKNLHFAEIPAVFVFDRQGKWTLFKEEPNKKADPNKVEETVVAFLKDK
jgi:thiol-disulfide isomerase/thioredoxin